MSYRDRAASVARWAGRLLLLIIMSYFIYSMLLMGYICVATGLQPYGQEHRLFYLTSGPLLIAGGLGILVFAIRWLARILRAARTTTAAGEPGPTA